VLCWFVMMLHLTVYFPEDGSYRTLVTLVQDVQLQISSQCTVFISNILQYSVYHSLQNESLYSVTASVTGSSKVDVYPVAYRGGCFGGFKPPPKIPKVSVESSIA